MSSTVKNIMGKIFRVTEIPTPKTLLLTDTVEVCGRGLVYSLASAHLRLDTDVLYLTTTLTPQCVESHVRAEGQPGKLIMYDGVTDPSGWERGGQQAVALNRPLPDIFSNRSGGDTGRKLVVVIDRLEHLTCHQEPLQLLRGLHALANGEQVEQVVVYCGVDSLEESILSGLTHAATATAHLQPTTPLSCRLMLKKPSGKVIKTHEEFTLSPEFEIQDIREAQERKIMTTGGPDETSETDAILASQTTFSLTLTHHQRQAKNSLLLPHTRAQSGVGGGGQIHYTPDDVDDWDDDDPDDDLDI